MGFIQGAPVSSSYTEPVQAGGGRTAAVSTQREVLSSDSGTSVILLAILERLCLIQLELQILNESQLTPSINLDNERNQLDAVFADPRCLFDASTMSNPQSQI